MLADDCLGLSAQLAYYFFLALFPALLFMVALISFLPVGRERALRAIELFGNQVLPKIRDL